MNPKLAKLIVKGAFGVAVSALIGYVIKAEREIDVLIGEYFDVKAG